MANLRANKLVGIGSTDAGVVFDGPIKINTQGVMYFPTGDTTVSYTHLTLPTILLV